jgi:hypothetical protein
MASAMSEKPILREVRAAVFAAVCVLVGVVGHDAFSPGGIPVWLLAACAGFLFLFARPLTTRERGLPSIVAAMAVVQLGLHEVFAVAQHHSATTLAAPMRHVPAVGTWWCGPKAPSGLGRILLSSYSASTLHSAGVSTDMGPSMSGSSMSSGMLAAHVVAALLAAWWLRRGEAAAWALTRTLAIRIVLPLRLLLVAAAAWAWTPPKAVRPEFLAPDRPGPGLLIRFTVARRGPPSKLAVAFC